MQSAVTKLIVSGISLIQTCLKWLDPSPDIPSSNVYVKTSTTPAICLHETEVEVIFSAVVFVWVKTTEM